MYKDRDSKPYFSDFFSRKDFSKQRKQKLKRSFVKIKLRLTSVFLLVLSFTFFQTNFCNISYQFLFTFKIRNCKLDKQKY